MAHEQEQKDNDRRCIKQTTDKVVTKRRRKGQCPSLLISNMNIDKGRQEPLEDGGKRFSCRGQKCNVYETRNIMKD